MIYRLVVVTSCVLMTMTGFAQVQEVANPTASIQSSPRVGQPESQREVAPAAGDHISAADLQLDALTAALQKLVAAVDLPDAYRDAPYEQYVDIRLLSSARRTMDCALLTDVTIQLATGEQTLLRPHKLISADALFRLASDWAVEKNDKDTLQRLELASRRFEKMEWSQYLASQQKLLGASRNDTPNISVPLDSTSLDEYAELRSHFRNLHEARMLKDWATLEALKERTGAIKITDQQRKYIEMISGASRAVDSASTKEDQETADVLNMLAADSRTNPDQGRQIAAGILQVIAGALNSQNGNFPTNNFPTNNFPTNNNISPDDNSGQSSGGSTGSGGIAFGLTGGGQIRPQPSQMYFNRNSGQWVRIR